MNQPLCGQAKRQWRKFLLTAGRDSCFISAVELRHHPLMNSGAAKNWPPIWAQATKDGGKTAQGEVGILKYALTDRRLSNKCFLIIEHGNERYSGTLSFDDAKFFLLIFHLLKNHVGRPIKEIGDLDLSYTW